MASKSLLSQLRELPSQSSGTSTSQPFLPRGAPVSDSPDFRRIRDIPRRTLDPSNDLAAVRWTKMLRRENPGCDCRKRWGYCIDSLLPIQGVALEEAHTVGSLVGLIGVGHGKTGLDILLPMVVAGVRIAVLLLPPKLRHQFLTQDYPQWSAHFRVPNLAGGNVFFSDGRPVLHLISYSELSQAKNSDILTRLRPDLVIADEAHNLKDSKSARTKRFLRTAAASTKFIPLSGTLTTRSPKDCAHLLARALGDRSPLPLHFPVLDEWAAAVEASAFPRPPGVLMGFCGPGENVYSGMRRRIIETPGVVATSSASVSNSLFVSSLPLKTPPQITELIKLARSGSRPDGEEAQDELTIAGWCRQLSAGFYYRWIYPRGEPEELIGQWFEHRKNYFREVREKLKHSREFLDSPLLLWKAAHRWHFGYSHDGKDFPPKTRGGPLPVWPSLHWGNWRNIRHQVEPQTSVVWVDDFLLDACAKWGQENVGIVWTEYSDFGARLAEKLGTAWYHGGGENPEAEKGNRTIVCSLKANSDGLNLQHAFSRNLFASIPGSGKTWEQAMGRTHRIGQREDTVEVSMFLHTPSLANSFAQARRDARYQQGITGSPQKLCYANIDMQHSADEDID